MTLAEQRAHRALVRDGAANAPAPEAGGATTPQALAPRQHPDALTPMAILNSAVERGADVTVLEKLLDLQERWEDREARKAFDEAISAAKAEIPTISKNRQVDFTTAKGRTNYSYEDLAGIAETVNPILAKHGLSYRFRTSSLPNEAVTVTCVISHRMGYSEENTLSAPRDESGNKNGIQAIGSTLTYLQRMSLKAALGLAAAADDDGRSSESADAPITNEQLAALRERIDGFGDNFAVDGFCKYLGVAALPELTQKSLVRANAALDKKASGAKQ